MAVVWAVWAHADLASAVVYAYCGLSWGVQSAPFFQIAILCVCCSGVRIIFERVCIYNLTFIECFCKITFWLQTLCKFTYFHGIRNKFSFIQWSETNFVDFIFYLSVNIMTNTAKKRTYSVLMWSKTLYGLVLSQCNVQSDTTSIATFHCTNQMLSVQFIADILKKETQKNEMIDFVVDFSICNEFILKFLYFDDIFSANSIILSILKQWIECDRFSTNSSLYKHAWNTSPVR